ncbi:serine protease 7 [Drosophila gunungcola]|uniref:CLIP domain-containing serine protease n=1 Tax=Drosophila gunungcola TaxID=103775 RepID=A0A9P9YXH1_9MUSC|nr:serine protease 7 [Drosophila gunungcola]KAI8044898.1 hypothetical protein M5D96_001073 [Drosophila gunungcola]
MKVFVGVFLCILIVREARLQISRCRNPNQRTGICVDIARCSPLNSGRMKTPSQWQFIDASRCYSPDSRTFVCCTDDIDFKRRLVARPNGGGYNSPPQQYGGGYNSPPQQYGGGYNSPPQQYGGVSISLPQQDTCGGDIVSLLIFEGKQTVLTKFSWMALLEYLSPDGEYLEPKCAGSLINNRYVLTAAHCLEPVNAKLVSVRLGEHDTRTDHDCQGRICAPGVITVPIEEKFSHESYYAGSNNFLHDIAIIRLAHEVAYSPTIRPICLPSTVGGVTLRPGQQLTVAGWGRTQNGLPSPTKLEAHVDYWAYDMCRRRYLSEYIALAPSQICALGKGDSCEGDSGGPLMAYRQGTWVLQGIVSFGKTHCGQVGWPSVYTNVTAYDDWIKGKMRP